MIRARSTVCVAALLGSLSAASLALGQTAAEYYISNSGSNDNPGTTPDLPYADMAPLGNGFGRKAATSHFERGGTWEMSGLSLKDGDVFDSYGEGPAPTIVVTGGESGFGGGVSIGDNAILDGFRIQTVAGSGITSGVMMSGTGSTVRNCEIDGTNGVFQLGFGVMGPGNLITGNIVHDLSGMTGDSGDMNTSGGAEAYMIMASDNEISYNVAINCWGPNTTLGGAEGGCLEIVNGTAESVIENVYFHHNYCERSVGLFEGCSGNFQGTDAIQEHHGIIRNSYVSYNISVDAMWLYLLQPVNTDFDNLVFEHNTIIHTPANEDIPQRGASSFGLMVTEDAGYSFSVNPGDITVRNNLFVTLDGAAAGTFSGPPAGDAYNNMFSPSAPMGMTAGTGDVEATDPGLSEDYRLIAGSPAIDKGSPDAWQVWTDFDGNPVPSGTGPDIGASEYCDGCEPSGAGGATLVGSGGQDPGVGGEAPASGGTPDPGAGGATLGSGGTGQPGVGGSAQDSAGAASTSAGASSTLGSGGRAAGEGGQTSASTAGTTGTGTTGTGTAGTSTGSAGTATDTTDTTDDTVGTAGAGDDRVDGESKATGEDAGCGCRVPGTPAHPTHPYAPVSLLLAAMARLCRKRRG